MDWRYRCSPAIPSSAAAAAATPALTTKVDEKEDEVGVTGEVAALAVPTGLRVGRDRVGRGVGEAAEPLTMPCLEYSKQNTDDSKVG